ncbi:taste receptor type 2 member 7-like [Macrotis lagotis]|uniref:taste receptor type 2 member 7-like n=1 Tax=Macrotis lagotis TaxID=92651 RepID=UPI003D6918F3
MAIGETIMGTWINLFIVLVNCTDWMKSRKFSLVDSILTGLAFSRIFLHWILIGIGLMSIFYKEIFVNSENILFLGYLWDVADYSSVSLATCLNVIYFLKIAYFSHPLFLWLKWRIKRVVLMILLGSLIMFLLMIFPTRSEFKDHFFRNPERKGEKNHTGHFQMGTLQFIVVEILFYMGPFSLLLISLISCFLLILSLWRHTQQMQLNATGFRDPSRDAHIRAMRWMVSYLILIILYYLGSFTILSTFSVLEQRLTELLKVVLAGFYPAVHSFILILGYSKLKQASLRMWHQALFYFQGEKP